MSADDIEAARAAFAEFERDMTETGAVSALREGVDYVLDILEATHSDAKSKQIAQNLLNSYRRKLIERISVVINDTVSFEDDYYIHWMSLTDLFREAGYDEDKQLSQLKAKLGMKAFEALSKGEKSDYLRYLERELDKRELDGK